MRGITKHYDGVAALTDVSFDVLPGEVHALLGENGAGKSTLMNVASGATTPDGGHDRLRRRARREPHAGERAGARDRDRPSASGAPSGHDGRREHPRRGRAPSICGVAIRDATKAMRSLLDDVHFLGHLEDRVSSLSVARRHLLELAKAFAVSPRLLILDEPTAPLSQDSVELLFTAVRKLAADGTAVVYITHRLGEVREIADRVTVLRDGRVRGTAAVAEISDAELLAMIIGRTLEATFPPKHTPQDDEAPLLRVEGLSGHGFENISLQRPQGRDRRHRGRGRKRPAGAPARRSPGATAATGSVNVAGKQLSRRALLESAAYMPADRLTEGLMLDLNVRENTALTALDRLTSGPVRESTSRARRRRARAVRAGGQGAVARGARLVALGREPAEGRDGARDALRAGDSRRGRADAGRRRRRARGDLPHPARGDRRRRAGRRRLERRAGARGSLRPRDRDVARPRRRDARGRRRDRGADRPRRDQRDDAHRRARRRGERAARRGSRASSRATTPRSSSSRP